jgi:type VI secretion system protein ImpF
METILQRLMDDNPKDQTDLAERDEKKDNLIDEILFILSSRPRVNDVGHLPLINESIINYGLDDVFPGGIPLLERISIMESRIRTALQRFEPRLKNVAIFSNENKNNLCSFIIEADTESGNVRYCLLWDNVLSQFYFRD